MELIKDNKFYQIYYDPDNNLIEYRWGNAILDLNEDEYKDILLEAYNFLFDTNVLYLIQNFKNAIYPVTPEFQEWLAAYITKNIYEKIGIKRIAFVMPEDFLSRIGVELLIKRAQAETPTIVRRYFDNLENAITWIQKNN